MKIYRALLSILVGLTLTLVCQGHDASSQHTGQHVSLLGEFHPAHPQPVHTPDEPGHAPAHSAAHADNDEAHYAITLDSADTITPPSWDSLSSAQLNGDVTLNAAKGLNSLAMQVAIIFAAAVYALRRYFSPAHRTSLLRAGISSSPEHPPPRRISPAVQAT